MSPLPEEDRSHIEERVQRTVGIAALRLPESKWLCASGWLMLAGIVIFSGSLYLLALTGARAFGAVTPFGGVAFLLAWMAFAVAAIKAR